MDECAVFSFAFILITSRCLRRGTQIGYIERIEQGVGRADKRQQEGVPGQTRETATLPRPGKHDASRYKPEAEETDEQDARIDTQIKGKD